MFSDRQGDEKRVNVPRQACASESRRDAGLATSKSISRLRHRTRRDESGKSGLTRRANSTLSTRLRSRFHSGASTVQPVPDDLQSASNFRVEVGCVSIYNFNFFAPRTLIYVRVCILMYVLYTCVFCLFNCFSYFVRPIK